MIVLLRKKALRKIFVTSVTFLVLLTFYLIPNINKENVIKTNLELEYVSGLGTNSIYLLDKNNYLVKVRVLLTEKKKEDKIKKIFLIYPYISS